MDTFLHGPDGLPRPSSGPRCQLQRGARYV